jgi:hypothetical protein
MRVCLGVAFLIAAAVGLGGCFQNAIIIDPTMVAASTMSPEPPAYPPLK